ncbi:nSTAND3 domain-containing NTPase [Enterobacter asburiae]
MQKKYVETRDFATAKNKIEHFNTLIITGEPGVGKNNSCGTIMS